MKFKKSFLFKTLSLVICLALIFQSTVVFACCVSPSIMRYAPDGTRNVAVDAFVQSSSSYESSNGVWSLKNINDGKLQNETGGFSTSVTESVPDEYTPAWILFDLEGYYNIQKVVLFAYGSFPDSYYIEVSKDNTNYTTVAVDSGRAGNYSNMEYSVDVSSIRYVRLYVTKRGNFDGNAIRFVQLSEIAIFGTECSPTNNRNDISSFSPPNCVNLATEATVSSNDSIEDTSISVNYINNNTCTDRKFFSSRTSGENSGNVYIDFELDNYAQIKRVVLFRTGIFPKALEIQVSLDGENYTTVKSGSDFQASGSDNPVFDFDASVFAKYVRVLVTQRNHGIGVEEERFYVQFGEIGVYGVKRAYQMSLNKNAVTLTEGESLTLEYNYKVKSFDDSEHIIQWTCENPQVAAINSAGELTAISAGKTFISITDTVSGIESVCNVTVKTEGVSLTDDVITSVFHGPSGDLINNEQYRLLAQAGIDVVYNIPSTAEDNLKSISLAHKNGISVVISDADMLRNCMNMTKAELEEWYERYRGLSGLAGIHVKDEPKNPNEYVSVYNNLKEIDSNVFVHLNFLPGLVYDSYEQYEYQLDDFAQLTNNTDYLMFDFYPFLFPTGVAYKQMFDSYNSVRKAGLKNNVKTAAYIQAVGYGPVSNENYSRRIPTATDIIYQNMISLAYGAKHLSYFKWDAGFSSLTEKFSDGGIDANGNPTQTYENIKNANALVHNLGATLKNLDAKEVYLSGSNTYSQETIPQSFFVTTNSNDSLVFSYMKDRQTNRNYLMIVNNNLDSSVTPSLNFDSQIDSISVVNNETGIWTDVNINGVYTANINAGSAMLIALPEWYDYGSTPVASNVNLAYHSSVGGTSSIGEDGWYLSCLTDGYTSTNSALGLKGWCSELKDAPYQTQVIINLGETKPFNSLTLYSSDERMQYFPKSYTVSASVDAITWTPIVSETNITPTSTKVYNTDYFCARYIKLSVTDMNSADGKYASALSEISLSSELSILNHKKVADGLDGYYVYACCAGADYVKMPTWTENAGQDDIVWHNAQKGDWLIDGASYNYRCYIPVSSHNNEIGKYITHIYAHKSQQDFKAIATSYDFEAEFTFNMNYANASENLVKGLKSITSGGGMDISYNGSEQALTINGTLTSNHTMQSYVPLNKTIKKGDKLKITFEKLSGNASNLYLTTELLNANSAYPCGVRLYKDINLNNSFTAVIDVNNESLAKEISAYKLWLYYNGANNQIADNVTFKIKIEIESGDYVYSPERMSVKYGEAFSPFYTPSNNGDGTFAGWFTAPVGGERVDLNDTNTQYIGNITLYAHWNIPEPEYLTVTTAGLSKSSFESEYLNTVDYVITYSNMNEPETIGTGTVVELRNANTGLIAQRYIVILYGDVDGDGWNNGQDAIITNCIVNGILGNNDIDPAYYLAADCNIDGFVDYNDIYALCKKGLFL